MSQRSFDKMAEMAAADSQRAFRRRLDDERRGQTRARRIRWTLRVILLLSTAGLFLAIYLHWVALGAICFLLILVCFPVLFLMGGLAVGSARRVLSHREKGLADD